MRPADTTPAPFFLNGQANPAKSTVVCQEVASQSNHSGPVILLLESLIEATAALVAALQRTTGWKVVHAQSPTQAYAYMSALRGRLKVAIITIGRNHRWAVDFIRQLKDVNSFTGVANPRVLVLSIVAQSPDVALSFEKLGAHYLLRGYPEQIIDVVRKIQWQCRTDKSLPTIVILRRSGHVACVLIKHGLVEFPVDLGPKLRGMVEYFAVHARTEHTTEMIAESTLQQIPVRSQLV
jgi:hypothetical protein